MVTVTAADAALFGFATVMAALPAVARSETGIATFNVVEFTNVVERSRPFHDAIAPGTNPVPVTVNNVLPVPAATLEGVTDVAVAFAFVTATCGVTAGPRSRTSLPTPGPEKKMSPDKRNAS